MHQLPCKAASCLLQNDTQNETLAGIKEAIELLRTTVGALQEQLAAGEVPTNALLDLAASADRLAERAAALAIEGLELLLQCCPACSLHSRASCLRSIAVVGPSQQSGLWRCSQQTSLIDQWPSMLT